MAGTVTSSGIWVLFSATRLMKQMVRPEDVLRSDLAKGRNIILGYDRKRCTDINAQGSFEGLLLSTNK